MVPFLPVLAVLISMMTSGFALLRIETLTRPGFNPDRPGKPMQDAVFSFRAASSSGVTPIYICGVLDGHGRKGHDVAFWMRDHLPIELERCCCCQTMASASEGEVSSLAAGLVEAYRAAQRAILKDTSIASRASGTTAVVAVIQPVGQEAGGTSKVLVANVGDSRAVLGVRTGRMGNLWEPNAFSVDTTTSLPEERARIEAAGGRIDDMGNVFAGPIGIAMTRALGDTVMASVGVLPDPLVQSHDLPAKKNEGQRFLLLASDGIFGVLSDQEAVDIIGAALDEHGSSKDERSEGWRRVHEDQGSGEGQDAWSASLRNALKRLACAAADKWQDGLPVEVAVDDISCILVLL